MKLGCSTVLFNQLDLYGALQHVAWAGYDGAELSCMANIAQHIELNTDQSYIDDVKSMARKHGLELFAIQAGFGAQSVEDKIKLMTKLFDVALKLNIPIVTARSEGKSGDKEATVQELKYFNKLGKEAESRGIILAIKAHAGASVYNTATLIQTLDEIDSPGLRANFDPLHLFISGDDPLEAVSRLGKRIVYTHFHDISSRDQSPAFPERQIPGRGKIDWLQILKLLRDLGYDKTVNTQVMGAAMYPLSRQMGIAAEARGYLNRCLQELK